MFPITDLLAFTVDELIMLFGNSDEDWSVESESLFPLPSVNESQPIKDWY